MVLDYCTKYELNQPILLWDIKTNAQDVWKSSHNYSNLKQSQMQIYWHKQHVISDNCNKYDHNHHIVLWDITTNTKNLWNHGHNYSNLAQSQILFYMHQLLLIPDLGTQYMYEENLVSHHGGMHKDGLTDWQTDKPTDWLFSCQSSCYSRPITKRKT